MTRQDISATMYLYVTFAAINKGRQITHSLVKMHRIYLELSQDASSIYLPEILFEFGYVSFQMSSVKWICELNHSEHPHLWSQKTLN